MCISRGVPISPLTTAWRTRAKLASNRRLKPICSFTPACSTAARARSIWPRLCAIGFSQKMCLPACAAWTMRSAWVLVEEQIRTASISEFAKTPALDSVTVGIPQRTATACAASRLTSAMASIRASGIRNASVSACTFPIRPAPTIPTFSCFVLKGSSLEMTQSKLDSMDRRYSRLRRALSFGVPIPGQMLLPHKNVTVVGAPREPPQQGREIHTTLAQFAEDSVAQRGEVIPLLRPCPARHLRLTVLAVDVPNPGAIALESRDHVAVPGSGPIAIVAGVEHQPEPLWIGQFEQGGDFIRRLHETCAVMVEDRPQSRLLKHGAGQLVGAVGENFPLCHAQSGFRSDPSGQTGSFRHRAVVVGQHEIGRRRSTYRGEQSRGLHRIRDAVFMRRWILQRHRYERSQHYQGTLVEFRPQHNRGSGHVAPITQFRSGVAGFGEFVQHAVKRDLLALGLIEFQGAPRTRGIANHQPCHILSSRLRDDGVRSCAPFRTGPAPLAHSPSQRLRRRPRPTRIRNPAPPRRGRSPPR